MASDRAFIFHMCISSCKALSLVPRSSVNIKYQGHILKRMAVMGGISVSQTQLVVINKGVKFRLYDERKN